jgi:transposase
MARYRHELTDEQWNRIQPLVPHRSSGHQAKDDRQFINAVHWIAKTGAPWRDLPERFGNWNTVWRRFSRWSAKGVWDKIFAALGLDADLEWVMMDSTVVRAHQHAAGGKGGPKTKLLDALEAASQPNFMP